MTDVIKEGISEKGIAFKYIRRDGRIVETNIWDFRKSDFSIGRGDKKVTFEELIAEKDAELAVKTLKDIAISKAQHIKRIYGRGY